MKATSAKQGLIAAKWILENIGWCQGAFGKTKAGVSLVYGQCSPDLDCACISGAIGMVECSSPMVRFVKQALEESDSGIARWNDYPGRTKTEVLKLMDRAIELAGGR